MAGGGSLSYNNAGQATGLQGWDVTYNCSDQITGILAPGKNIAYRYNGAGQRVEKTVNGTTQKFLWNGGEICKEYRADGSVRADYFLGAGREGIKTGGQWHWYLSDVQGSTLMLTDPSGHPAATYDHSDYGETRQTSGSAALYNPFLYTGQEYDFETSLYHLRARHYSPARGRFFARDPIGYAGGSNMYAYCAGDPVNFIDPSGLDRIWIGTGRDISPIVEFTSQATFDRDATFQEAASAFQSTTGLFLLFGHNYASRQNAGRDFGFHFSGGQNQSLELFKNFGTRPSIVAFLGCNSGHNYDAEPGLGQGTLVLRNLGNIGAANFFIKPFVNALLEGQTLQQAVDMGLSRVPLIFRKKFANALWVRGGGARL